MSRAILLLVTSLFIIGLVISCTEEKVVNYESPTVSVTGKVYGRSCGTGDCRSPQGNQILYSLCTGLPATVKFVRADNCCTVMYQTDDSSAYVASPDVGDYFIVVETKHGCPDTVFGITLDRDTVIDFDIDIEYKTPDTIFADYYYGDPTDSMGYQLEWNHIRTIDDIVGNMLDLEGTTRTIHESQFSDWILVSYHIPIKPEYAPWQVYNNALSYLASSCKPPGFSLLPDYWFCQQ